MLTYGELKKIVVCPEEREKKPTLKKLKEAGVPIVAQKIIEKSSDLTRIIVYKNGLISYQVQNRSTVFPIEDLAGYQYFSVAGNEFGCSLEDSYFEDEEWYLLMLLYGEDCINKNVNAQFQRKCIASTEEMEDLGLHPKETIQFEDDLIQELMTEYMLDTLTKVQREVLQAIFIDGLTYQEYATEQGIKVGSVYSIRRQALNKLREKLQKEEKNEKK